jgi:putative ABC transport system permease protein
LQQHRIVAVLPAYLKMNRIKISRGRLFSELYIDYGLQVCLVGQSVAKEMFPRKDPLEQQIPINGHLFQVLGVLTGVEHTSSDALKDSILIPLPAALRLFSDKKATTLHLRGKDTGAAMAEIKQFLFRRFGEAPDFEIQSQRQILKAQQQSLGIFKYVLWAIGSISLLVGGIGIMNIMLVSVTERVREIGIRRAVGATRAEIKMQFLCEAMLLCVLGGLGGALLGFAGSKLISRLFGFSPIFSPKLLIVAIAIASTLGLICGTYPAVRAANQDPTIVLRYD